MGVQSELHPGLIWRKSRVSQNQGDCIEMALSAETVLVRDSRDPAGPVLVLTPGQWWGLVSRIRAGHLDSS